ncbi:O-acyltransferase wsd1 [Thalictrum thalictroides]|uniref:diacylglycerol O-acyltransferase n=1 Tax=Thalictrum thalictroides TaxID=46969 RepID=A0A7J6WWI6_THATH|nr:O-acyltransferase wsd1 [Thalictrum thalictroides]
MGFISQASQTDDEESLIPMSPSSQSLNSSHVSLYIVFVAELETKLDELEITEVIRTMFLPLNERFSAITEVNKKGIHCWKKVDVRVEDHIVVPVFAEGLSTTEYDKASKEYIANIAGEALPLNKPYWEIHVLKYPTLNGLGSLAFKFSHVLGDGYSILSVIYKVCRRADDPSLPFTIPNISLSMNRLGKNSFWGYISKCINTVSDLTLAMMKGSFLEDSKSAIRSGMLGVEFEPLAISSVFIPMDRLKEVKTKLGGTVNDVVSGVIYYTLHLYRVKTGDISGGKDMNLLVMFNMRIANGYKNIDEMLKADIWGNHVALLHVPIPCLRGDQKSLVFTIGSYKGQLNITATTEKNFIDTQLFKSCMMEAFNNIYDAACFRRA